MKKLFNPVKTAYDPKNKPVHICKDDNGKFYVYKPSSGFKSRSFDTAVDKSLVAIYDRQSHDAQTFASYLPGEAAKAPVKKEKVPAEKAGKENIPVIQPAAGQPGDVTATDQETGKD